MSRMRALVVVLGAAALACTPAGPVPATAGDGEYVVRVTTGDRENVPVDWAILPDEGWPIEGQRDRTPFTTTLPAGQVAAIFRTRSRETTLELTILKREADGSLRRLTTAGGLSLGAVTVDPKRGKAEILSTVAAADLRAGTE